MTPLMLLRWQLLDLLGWLMWEQVMPPEEAFEEEE